MGAACTLSTRALPQPDVSRSGSVAPSDPSTVQFSTHRSAPARSIRDENECRLPPRAPKRRPRSTRTGITLPRSDGRTISSRRFASLCEEFAAELGGSLSAVDQNLVKQAANLVLASEIFQTRIVNGAEVVRMTLQKLYYRREMLFGEDGRGHVTLLLRTILESEGNQDALVEPIVSAVSTVMEPKWTEQGLRWIEAWDAIPLTSILQTLRDLLGEQDIWQFYCRALRRKIARTLEPAQAKPGKQPKVKAAPKPPPHITRIPAIEKKIGLGLQLLELRSKVNDMEFRRLRRKSGADPSSAVTRHLSFFVVRVREVAPR